MDRRRRGRTNREICSELFLSIIWPVFRSSPHLKSACRKDHDPLFFKIRFVCAKEVETFFFFFKRLHSSDDWDVRTDIRRGGGRWDCLSRFWDEIPVASPSDCLAAYFAVSC